MIYPTIDDLTKNKYNRYELAIATAKSARIITNEYTKRREYAEKVQMGLKDSEKSLITPPEKEEKEEKAVKKAINKIYSGEYVIVRRFDDDDDGDVQLSDI